MAHGPLQVWSWDITKLAGPVRGVFFDCYAIIDIFSRYIVGWTVAESEDSLIAEALIDDAIKRHGVGRDQLTLHADRDRMQKGTQDVDLRVGEGATNGHPLIRRILTKTGSNFEGRCKDRRLGRAVCVEESD